MTGLCSPTFYPSKGEVMGQKILLQFGGEIKGQGFVTEPTPMGTFIADTLNMMLPRGAERRQHKQVLASEMMHFLVNTDFGIQHRMSLAERLVEHFGIQPDYQARAKLWLVERINQCVREHEDKAVKE